jgi:hypothetical protein
MKIIYPTDKVKKVESIFLAGTIDMGNSEDWQKALAESLKDYDIDVYNPRRPDWDSSWKQTIEDENFSHQVNWELSCLEKSDLIVMYLAPGSKSPISLLEMGIFRDKLLVCCPDGFYRKGNVDITCQRYNVVVCNNFTKFVELIKEKLEETI